MACREGACPPGPLSGLLSPVDTPPHPLLQPRPRFSGSGVGPGEHTQVPLGVRVQLQVQGPTLPDVALYNKHGVFVILQPGLGVALHCSVLHLPWQGQLQLFPKI